MQFKQCSGKSRPRVLLFKARFFFFTSPTFARKHPASTRQWSGRHYTCYRHLGLAFLSVVPVKPTVSWQLFLFSWAWSLVLLWQYTAVVYSDVERALNTYWVLASSLLDTLLLLRPRTLDFCPDHLLTRLCRDIAMLHLCVNIKNWPVQNSLRATALALKHHRKSF